MNRMKNGKMLQESFQQASNYSICGLKYQPESFVEAVQGWAVVINTSTLILFKAKINLIVHL